MRDLDGVTELLLCGLLFIDETSNATSWIYWT